MQLAKTLLIISVLATSLGCKENTSSESSETLFVLPKRQPISDTLNFVGKVVPDKLAEVRAPISNKIEKLYVGMGQKVKKGQPLFEYDSALVKSEMAEKKQTVAAKRVEIKNQTLQLKSLEKRYKRARTLFRKKIGSRADMESAEQELIQAQNSFAVVQQEMRGLREQLRLFSQGRNKLKFFAPISGTVVQTWLGTKTFVKGTAVNEGDLLVTVANISRLKVSTASPEADATKLFKGMYVAIKSAAAPGIDVPGEITNLFSVPITDPDSGVPHFPFEVRIEGTYPHISVGTSVDCEVVVQQKDSALVIPLAALQYDSAQHYVEVRKSGNVIEKRFIELGIRNDLEAEVVSGLSEQDQVKIN